MMEMIIKVKEISQLLVIPKIRTHFLIRKDKALIERVYRMKIYMFQ